MDEFKFQLDTVTIKRSHVTKQNSLEQYTYKKTLIDSILCEIHMGQ